MKKKFLKRSPILFVALIGIFFLNIGGLAAQPSVLLSGSTISGYSKLKSPNGSFDLSIISGKVVLRRIATGTVLWSKDGNQLTLQSSGNLVSRYQCNNFLYPPPNCHSYNTWSSGTAGSGSNCQLLLQDNGTLVLLNSSKDRIWFAGAPHNMAFSDWMSTMPDATYLSELSIPGTHQSGALHNWLTGGNQVTLGKCQNAPIDQQLDAGVRFFDIRVKCEQNPQIFQLWHGIVNQNQDFQSVLDAMVNFLNNHNKEVVIMRVKSEPNHGCNDFDDTFKDYLDKTIPGSNPAKTYRDYFHDVNGVPKLGDCRGKIMMLNKIGNTIVNGMISSSWDSNTKKDVISTTFNSIGSGDFVVQDFYSMSGAINTVLIEKGNVFSTLFDEAVNAYDPAQSHNTRAKTMYLNHTSGATFSGDTRPATNYMYNIVENKLTQGSSRRRCGIIAMDFIDERYELVWGAFPWYYQNSWHFVNKIIQTNYY